MRLFTLLSVFISFSEPTYNIFYMEKKLRKKEDKNIGVKYLIE